MPRTRWLTGLVLAWAGCAPAVQDRVRDYNEDGVFLYKQGDFLAARQSFEAALALQPVIGEVLADLRNGTGCRLARMSGSGATCFGLFDTAQAAATAAAALSKQHPVWWVRATTLG